MSRPTDEDRKRARKMMCWAGSGLEIFQAKLATEFATIREEARASLVAEWAEELRERGDFTAEQLTLEKAVMALLTPEQLRSGGFGDLADAVERARRG